jgi:hypothetical protein
MGCLFRQRVLLALALAWPLAPAVAEPWRHLEGVVVDKDGAPVADAVVRLRAEEPSARTDRLGRFTLVTPAIGSGIQITAAKPGYIIAGAPLVQGAGPYRLVLQPIAESDDASYAWVSAYVLGSAVGPIEDTGREPCGACHRRIEAEWRASRHAHSAVNPTFLAFFNGKGDGANPAGGPFYHRDFPLSNGNCAHCHLPVLGLAVPRDADPATAEGVAREGIGCDFCHKIAGLDPAQAPRRRPAAGAGSTGRRAARARCDEPGLSRQPLLRPLP